MFFANALTQTAGADACQPQTMLTKFGLTAATAAVSTVACTNYYSAKGACVDPTTAVNWMTTYRTWLMGQAINAQAMNRQFINATYYFDRKYNSSTTIPSDGTVAAPTTANTVLTAIGNFFTSIVNNASNFFSSAKSYIVSIFSNSVSDLNKCFNAYANITNGAVCALTSQHQLTIDNTTTVPSSVAVNLLADLTSTGTALAPCMKLINVYCSLFFNIALTGDAPFNTTFEKPDGGLTKQQCTNFKAVSACTTAECTKNMNTYLLTAFQSNWIKFVPSAASLEALGTFYAGTATIDTLNVTQQAANGNQGIVLHANTAGTGENFHADGVASLQPVTHYGVGMISLSAIVLLFTSF